MKRLSVLWKFLKHLVDRDQTMVITFYNPAKTLLKIEYVNLDEEGARDLLRLAANEEILLERVSPYRFIPRQFTLN